MSNFKNNFILESDEEKIVINYENLRKMRKAKEMEMDFECHWFFTTGFPFLSGLKFFWAGEKRHWQ